MIFKKAGIVDKITAERAGAQEIDVLVGADRHPAINYPTLTGEVEPGDTVIINTTAATLQLGTGGVDFVIHVGALPSNEIESGHLMKLRYTPLQFAAQAAEEKFAEQMPNSLENTPVIACALHSQIAPITFAIHHQKPDSNIVYVMTDSAALPLGFSRLVPALKEAGLISATITCGQSFGGDLEAVNLYSALLLAKGVLKADAIIVSQGPGNTGTQTKWGFSAIDQGTTLNAILSLNGMSIACPRISFADSRERHQGLSHHSITVLKQVVLGRCQVALPKLPETEAAIIQKAIQFHQLDQKHDFEIFDCDLLFDALKRTKLPLNTMRRSPDEDSAFFKAGLAAGLLTLKGMV